MVEKNLKVAGFGIIALLIASISTVASATGAVAAEIPIEITNPANGGSVPLGQQIIVQGHVNPAEGFVKVEARFKEPAPSVQGDSYVGCNVQSDGNWNCSLTPTNSQRTTIIARGTRADGSQLWAEVSVRFSNVPSGIPIEITVPKTGTSIPLGQQIIVQGHVNPAEGFVKVEARFKEPAPSVQGDSYAFCTLQSDGDWTCNLLPNSAQRSTIIARGTRADGSQLWVNVNVIFASNPTPGPAPDDLPKPLRTISVSSISEMMTAIGLAKPGDHIVLKAGKYDTSSYFSANSINRLHVTVDGTQSNPIVIRAESEGAVEILGPASLYLNGASNVVVYGFKFIHSQDDSAATDDIAIRCNNCDNVRFSNNIFALTTKFTNLASDVDRYHSDWVGFTGTSSNNRVDHNEFRDKYTRGVFLFVFGSNGRVVQNTLVDHNLFSGQSYVHGNGGECFRIGNSALGPAPGNMVMEYNTFEHCDGDREAITIKASNNIIRYNTFRNNEGSLTFRHGNSNTADGNMFIDGNNGIRVYGHDHRIINNYFANNPMSVSSLLAPVVIGRGTVPNDLLSSNSEHSQPRNILIAHNTLVNNKAGIVIGYGGGSYAATGIILANNIVTGSVGKLVTMYSGSTVEVKNNLLFPSGSAGVGDVPASGYKNLNPLLTSSAGVMIPSASSPAVNAVKATDAYGITKDIKGRERTAMFDLGAHEVA